MVHTNKRPEFPKSSRRTLAAEGRRFCECVAIRWPVLKALQSFAREGS
jgi:hypothetical protein